MPLTSLTFILFPAIGSIGGFLAGLLGIGGGIVFVPLFLWAFPLMVCRPEVAVHCTFGTSLAVIIPTALSSALGHRQRGNVNWHQVYRLGAGAVAGAFLGGMAAAGLPGEALKGFFGAMQVLVGLRLFLRPRRLPPEREAAPSFSSLFLVGFSAGVFSTFFGVGGGVVAVPLMILVLQLPTQLAIGNSSALIVIASLAGAVSYAVHGWGAPQLPPFSAGYVNLLVVLLVAPAAVVFARIGVRVAGRLGDDKLLKAFALLLIAIGAKLVVHSLA